jgi:hypothetical protein
VDVRVDARVGVLDPAEGLVAEHDAEPEAVVTGIALPHRHPVLRTELLDQCGEIEAAGGPPTTAMRIAPSPYSSVLGGLGTATGGSAGTSPRRAKLVGW